MSELDNQPRTVSESILRNRRIGERLLSLPPLLPTKVKDPHKTLETVGQEALSGRAHVFIFSHFGLDDGPRVDKVAFQIPGVGERVVLNPISKDKYHERLARFADQRLGGPMIPVINNDVLERPEYEDMGIREAAAIINEFMDASALALKNGESITLAINGGRRPFLDMDDDQNVVGTFVREMRKRGITDFGIVPVALSVPGANDYEKRHLGGLNLGKKYLATIGDYQTMIELSANRTVEEIDQEMRRQFMEIIPDEYKQPETFDSVAVIGAAGKVGEMFYQQIGKRLSSVPLTGIVKPGQEQTRKLKRKRSTAIVVDDLELGLSNTPDAVILATANLDSDSAKVIADQLHDGQTLILPQNGVEIVHVMHDALAGKNVQLIRASLFTPVSRKESGKVSYDGSSSKLRIGLSSVTQRAQEGDLYLASAHDALQKAKALFLRSGFDVELFDDFVSMEWTKLVVNTLGASSAITGLSHKETLEDKELFAFEAAALKDRLALLKAEGIDFADIPWSKIDLIPKLKNIPAFVTSLQRKRLAQLISKGREHQPSAAAVKIAENNESELSEYILPFIDLSSKHRLPAVADEAILTLLDEHQRGLIDLSSQDFSPEERKELLLSTYRALRAEAFNH